MALQSMTGFARSEGESGRFRWAWELRSVNGKGLDLRFRLPAGYDQLEADCRAAAGAVLNRGNVQVALTLTALDERVEAVVNEDALAALLALKTRLGAAIDPAPLSFDALLGMRGIIDFREPPEAPEAAADRSVALFQGFRDAVDALRGMREREGGALGDVLLGQVSRIEDLALKVEADPSRQPQEIARRLQAQVEALLGATQSLDRDRLHAEAALIATKADLREEIDRLKAHVAVARELITAGGPIGRKLDFLAQEFNRESNTICSKSNAASVTAHGLELKVVIDQFREQVQNLE
jgi:uncharacterized protein (TIGR00255 family)